MFNHGVITIGFFLIIGSSRSVAVRF